MKKFLLFSISCLLITACSNNDSTTSQVDATLNATILDDFSANLARPVYSDLASKTSTLYDEVLALSDGEATDEELVACQTTWKAARSAYEQSEAFLFGPVATDDIDPSIDTWPVNFTDLDSQLNSENAFTEEYINELEDALKGFHPIEYLIFGLHGDKKAKDLTARDLEYLKALALNLKTLTADLNSSWDPSTSNNYHTIFTTAGEGSTVYTTQYAAFEELVKAMSGICEEVATGKIKDVYDSQDSTLEESPFSKNSIADFTSNIKGVQDVYLGKYTVDGKGLEDLVKNSNLQLDSDIKAKLSSAIASLNAITDPFGRAAALTQRVQVQNAMTAISALQTELDENLLPFVQKHVK
ncbi:MAG TPA: imelysin family protein [Cyclobacteriaceae bacterium]|nr:imelysin family protein [Cyclobacteriaceae bacterium]